MAVPQWMLDEFLKSENPDYEPRTRSIAPKRGDAIFEGVDYPREWAGFIGQEQAKEQLMVQVASAAARGARIEHTLLASGQHGVGKTTLATLLAYKAGAGLLQTSGPLDADKARRLILSMNDRDVLFIDEAHRLVDGGKTKADWLLPFMTEGRLYTESGAVECPDIAIVGATTDAGKLPQTILSRFMVKPKLVAYTDAEGALIAANLADRMHVEIAEDSFEPIARAASCNPRDMRSILTALRDLQLAFPDREPDLIKAFDWAGFSPDGLTQISRDLLVVLRQQSDHTASIESLASILSEPGSLRHHEQALLQRGYVEITGRGRKLTPAGVRRAEQLGRELAS